ncbi:MAG: glycosyltransferase involved in cell wall biosynthesis [Parvicellaceae bacterium]|jgi:glycosyltransferase involved in cell wall biosynthesis
MQKSLLILTQYFPPEVGAPQNRLFELAIRLQKAGIEVTVLTAMPNYPKGEIHPEYLGKKYHYEVMDGLKVHRSSIYVTKSKSIPKRLRNYFSFVHSSYRVGKTKLEESYDFLLCESPPLFLAKTAVKLANKKKAKFIFNVSDLWPESAEKLGLVTNKFFLKLAQNLEEKTYEKADLITGQTQGISENISTRFPHKKVYWLPNGVDLEYYNPSLFNDGDWRKENKFKEEDVLFFYGGIIGHAQRLEVILQAASKVVNPNIQFILMGAGPEKIDLLALKEQNNLKNVHFFEPVTKLIMPSVLSAVDISLIPLRKLDLFKGAIPSKIFESLAMEIPILLGVDGEARELFIDEGKCGYYFEPENVDQLVEQAERMGSNSENLKVLGQNGRAFADLKFNRNKIAEDFLIELEKL